MKIQELMVKDVHCCAQQDTLNTAAHLMWTHDCGCVPVTDDDGRVVGMLTDRDICMAAYTRGRPLIELPVADSMSTSVHTVGPQETLARAEQIMAEHQIRRLPVVGESGRLIGLISFNDLARRAASDVGRLRASVPARDLSRTLGAICKPRVCHVADKPAAGTSRGKRRELIMSN